jgi:hypothetical protein
MAKKYIAKSYIGGYNVGDEIPESKALVWKQMYKVWPIEVVEVLDAIPVAKQEEIIAQAAVEVVEEVKQQELAKETPRVQSIGMVLKKKPVSVSKK